MKFVGKLLANELAEGAMVRLAYPPFDVLVAEVDGEPYAIEDGCNHAGASLALGKRKEDGVSCPMHGYVFDLKSGALLRPRGLCADQRTFVVRRVGDEIHVFDPVTDLIGSIMPR